MRKKPILVLGSGHLASELCRELVASGERIRYIPSQEFIDVERTSRDESSVFSIRKKLEKSGTSRNAFAGVCIADSEDRTNINLLLALLPVVPSIPIVVSLLNENTDWGDVHALPPNVRISNSSRVSTPEFLSKLDTPPTDAEQNAPHVNGRLHGNRYLRSFPFLVILSLFCFIAGSAYFFCVTEHIGWPEGVYYTVTVVTGAGVGDTPIMNREWYARSGRTVIVIVGYMFAVFGIGVVAGLIQHRREEATRFGRKRHRVHDHIIVAGLGKFGFFIATALLERGDTVVVIEEREDNPFLDALRSTWGRKAHIFVGKANIRENLVDAGIDRARGFIVAVNNDLVNLEIALTALRARPNLRIVLRLFDSTLATSVHDTIGFRFIVNTSANGAGDMIKHLRGIR
jgi:Trk K+ transport system NAD-binding subunit